MAQRLNVASSFDNSLGHLFHGSCKKNSPHLVMELTLTEWLQVKHNSIRLSNLIVNQDSTGVYRYYNTIHYGKNVITLKKKSQSSYGWNIGWMNIDICNMKKKLFGYCVS